MKNVIFSLAVFLFLDTIPIHIYSSENNLSDLQISLLTYSQGSRLYSIFGHSAIKIFDPVKNTDLVYNYGTFNFSQPGFYFRFLQGNLIYSLSCTSFGKAKQTLMLENRSLIETPLILKSTDKARVIACLENNFLPENRDYRYDFFYDNCATRIIDLLYTCTADSLVLKPEVLPVKTFRQLINPYLENRPWAHAGIDLLMGLSADKVARLTEPAFLPDYLHVFTKNFYAGSIQQSGKLSHHDIIHFQNYPVKENKKLTPSLFLWPLLILLLISALIDSYFRPLFQRTGNILLFLTGVISLLLCYLWVFSDHAIFRYNIDLLWANPLLLPVTFFRNLKIPSRHSKLKKCILWVVVNLVSLGTIVSLIFERNLNLTALGLLVLIVIANKLKN